MKQVYVEKKNCCGCTACMNVCPKHAIQMEADDEGFSYPVIDEGLCVECGLCKRTCSFEHSAAEIKNQRYYAVKNKNDKERQKSRSGGFFYVLAKYVIKQKGIVYGVILDENMIVRHKRITTLDECTSLQGSKYVQSDLTDVYTYVKKDLAAGNMVLFSGTACQIAGLDGYLQGRRYDNLITVDIICHGVASPLIFKEYIQFLEKKYKGRVEQFDFRDKSMGWDQSIEAFWIKKKKKNAVQYSRLYGSARAMRPSCYHCPFTNFDRPANITIGDFWGSEKSMPNFNDNKGVSLVIVNNETGEHFFNMIKEEMHCVEVEKQECVQPNLRKPTKEPNDRVLFWNTYKEKGFTENLKIWGSYQLLKRIKCQLIVLKKSYFK